MKKKISIVMTAVIISACGLLDTPPSDDEIRELFSKELAETNKQVSGFGGKKIMTHLESLVNHGCEPHENMEGAYTCDLEMTMQSEMMGKKTGRTMVSFAKSKAGDWYGVQR